MSDFPKRRPARKFITATHLALVGILLLLVALLFGLTVSARNNVAFHWNDLRSIRTAEVTINGGTSQKVTLPTTLTSLSPGDQVVLSCTVNTNQHASLLYDVRGAALDVSSDGELILSTGQPGIYPAFQKTPAPAIGIVALPDEAGSKHLVFSYTLAEASNSLSLPLFYFSDSSLLFWQLFTSNIGFFLLSIFLTLGGIILIVASLAIWRRIPSGAALIWLGLSCFCFGVWSLSINNLMIYLMPPQAPLYVLGYVAMFSFLPPFLAFGNRFIMSAQTLFLSSLAIFAQIVAILAVAAHLTGVLPFAQSGTIMRFVMAIIFAAFMENAVYERVKQKNPMAVQLLPPCILLSVFIVADLIDSYFTHFFNSYGLLQIGTLIFSLWMAALAWRFVAHNFDQARRNDELAIEIAGMANNLEKQRNLYSRLVTVTEETRAMRHDMRHQLSALRGYLQKEDTKGGLEYLSQLDRNTADIATLMISDNFAVNAVTSHYLYMAQSEQIQCDFLLTVPEKAGQIDDSDLAVVFGNLLENAIEACAYLPPEKRFIKMRSQVAGKQLTLTIDNSFDGSYKEEDGNFISRKRDGWGVGISSVQTIVNRYRGTMKIEAMNGVFMVSLYILM